MKNEIIKLKKKYKLLGLKKNQNLYITADFGKLVNYKQLNQKTINNHFEAISEIIGKGGTIIVPTATLNLCNTKKIFYLDKTPSFNMGSFSEYVRKLKISKRSFHPFWSVSAIGKNSTYFTKKISKHAFGYDSIWTRLLKKNAMSLHIGVDPKKSISIIHYIELLSGVPYRHTKEFKQLVFKDNRIIKESYYHFCISYPKKIKRDKNEKIFKNFQKINKIKKIKVGKGEINFFSLQDFTKITLNLFKKDIYCWIKK